MLIRMGCRLQSAHQGPRPRLSPVGGKSMPRCTTRTWVPACARAETCAASSASMAWRSSAASVDHRKSVTSAQPSRSGQATRYKPSLVSASPDPDRFARCVERDLVALRARLPDDRIEGRGQVLLVSGHRRRGCSRNAGGVARRRGTACGSRCRGARGRWPTGRRRRRLSHRRAGRGCACAGRLTGRRTEHGNHDDGK